MAKLLIDKLPFMKDSGISKLKKDKTQLFYSGEINQVPSGAYGLVEQSQNHVLPYGHADISLWDFDGIHIRHSITHYNDYYTFEKENSGEVVTLGFNLRGNSIISQCGQVFKVDSLQHNIIYTNGHPNTFRNGTLESETLTIEFCPETFLHIIENSNDCLKRFAEKINGPLPVVISHRSLTIVPALYRALKDMLLCRYSGKLRKMFLLSKSIEILVIQAEAFSQAEQSPQSILKSQRDRDRMIGARDYLLQHFDNPPNLSELAGIVSTNEYKLKKGFKEIFGTTVFGYLSDYRLDRAYEELSGGKTVSETAYAMGYSSPQHFSSAFKKKFGIPPKSVKN